MGIGSMALAITRQRSSKSCEGAALAGPNCSGAGWARLSPTNRQKICASITVEAMYRRVKKALAKRFLVSPSNAPTETLRLSSFPFLSGDTFRAMAGTVWEEGAVKHERDFSRSVVFVEADTALSVDQLDKLIESNQHLQDPEAVALIIHNGDTPPDQNTLAQFTKRATRVYSVNVLDDIDGVTPIPIGLENVWHNKSGRLRYYLDRPIRPVAVDDYDHLVVSSFSVGTNRAKRQPVADLMAASRHGHQGMVWKSGEFREVISRSLFVVSPPGNGADAHRTWEAIYLGAIPVVDRTSLASSLTGNLPILAVESYEEFVEMSDDELFETYLELRKRPTEKAYAPYWVSQILGKQGA